MSRSYKQNAGRTRRERSCEVSRLNEVGEFLQALCGDIRKDFRIEATFGIHDKGSLNKELYLVPMTY